jgi:peptide/nickel transport system substrate-binding protein
MRRFSLIGLGGILLALLVAACGSSGGNGTVTLEEHTKVSAACSTKPVLGGNLVYAHQAETITLNPYFIKNAEGDIWPDEMIYEKLVKLNPEGTNDEIQPGLAESWKTTNGGKTYTFKIRPGLKFSDGTPVTMQDIKWSLENFGNPKKNEVMAILIGGYESTKIVDDHTIQVNLGEPTADFLYNISEWPAAILPQKQVEEQGEAFWKHPVGTGPFRVTEFSQGSHISFEKNPYYYETDKPYLKSMRWNFDTEGNTRVLALKSGQAQIANGIPYSQIPSLQEDSNFVVQTTPVPGSFMMTLNEATKPFADANVRTAMNYAIDREQINKVVFKGVGKVPNSMFGPFEGYDSSAVKPYEHNVQKAKEYLKKSAYPTGFSFTLQYPSGSEVYKQMTLLIQQQLSEVGISAKLEEIPSASAPEHWLAREYEAIFPFTPTISDVPVPDEYAGFFALPSAGLEGFGTGWSDPVLQKRVEKFQTTPDTAARVKQWATIQKEFYEQSPAINVIDTSVVTAHATNVCGTYINGLGVDRLEYTWLAPKS